MRRFYNWWAEQEKQEDKKISAVYLKAYLEHLANVTSGEYVVHVWKVLRHFFRDYIQQRELNSLEEITQILRRNANQKTPVKQRAASAVRLRELDEIMKMASHANLTKKEKRTLEILSIAFVTMSRVAEVCSLEVGDVSVDGTTISIRPKMWAYTWKRMIKRVANIGHIRASEYLHQAQFCHQSP